MRYVNEGNCVQQNKSIKMANNIIYSETGYFNNIFKTKIIIDAYYLIFININIIINKFEIVKN